VATIGVDLGGTKILAVRVDDDGNAGEIVKRSTPLDRGADGVIDAIVEVIDEVGRDGVAAVGIGSPGIVVPGLGVVGHAPNLPGWTENVPLGARLGDALQVPVIIENDVNAAVLGERAAGAGRGQDDVLGLWLGTGVGGGLILDGRLRRGPRGAAGEIGHTIVQHGGRRCACGGKGHLEAYAGRAAMEAEARRRHAAGEATLLVDLAGDGRMKSGVFAKALAKGDRMAADLIDGAVTAIGVSLATVVMLVDISFVVVGGGLAEKLGNDLVSRVAASTVGLLPAGLQPGFALASLGDESGALGAAELAREAVRGG
jgi:glucokinase